MEAKTVYGVKYYIKEVGTEFELFLSLSDAEHFWNNKSFDKIVPMKMVKGRVNEKDITKNEFGGLILNEDYDSFKTIETIKTNA